MKLVLSALFIIGVQLSVAFSQERSVTWFEAENYVKNLSAKKASQLVENHWATQGTLCQLFPGAQIQVKETLFQAGAYYVFFRCPAYSNPRIFSVNFDTKVHHGIFVNKDNGSGWRWGRVGPFLKENNEPEEKELTIKPSTGYTVYLDVIAICRMEDFTPEGLPVEVFEYLEPTKEAKAGKRLAASYYLEAIPHFEQPADDPQAENPKEIRYEAEDFAEYTLPLPDRVKFLTDPSASGGKYCQVLPGAKIMINIPLLRSGEYSVYVRCLPGSSHREFAVQFGDTRYSGVVVDKKNGNSWRWARVGPFQKHHEQRELRKLELVPTNDLSFFVDTIMLSQDPYFKPSGAKVEAFSSLRPQPVPGPDTLLGLKKLSDSPPTYQLKHFIVQAPPDRIYHAVAWVRFVESSIYPTMLDMLGHKPAVSQHVIEFCYKNKNIGVYTGKGRTIEGEKYHASQIYIHPHKLDIMPPYQTLGGVAWESMHGLLDEAKHKADWKPIWETELLDVIFEMELAKRLGCTDWSEDLWNRYVTKRPESSYAVLALFWKEQGWEPFQNLLTQLHEDPNFKPKFDQSTFIYHISLCSGKDVSSSFEKQGWTISPIQKRLLQDELKKPY